MVEFSRKIDIGKILRSQCGRVDIEATEGERGALSERFGFIDIRRLTLEGNVSEKRGRGYLFKGVLSASISQACVQTQKPVLEDIEESVEVFLVYKLSEDEGDYSFDEELIEAGCVDFGEVAAQYLSLFCDPYPLCKEF